MTPRQLIFVWLTAFGLLALLTTGPVWLLDRAARAQHSDIFVLGTSLMAHAVPATGVGPTSLLGDRRSHIRIASRRVTETELLARLDQAIDQRPALIFLEVNPFLFDFADQARRRPCDGWIHRVRSPVGSALRRARDAYLALTGQPLAHIFSGEPPGLASRHIVDPTMVDILYPLTLRAPCDAARLAAAVARAKAQATKIVLILPPRSPDADRLLGPAVTAALRSRADTLAARLRVDLVVLDGDWPNAEFADAAHVNLAGRAHFLRDLRRWWALAQ